MGESEHRQGLSRRDLIKRSAIAGGVAWAAPALLASPAGASHSATCCTGPNKFILKSDDKCEGKCEPGTLFCPGFSGSANCCLKDAGLVSYTCTGSDATDDLCHVWTLAAGVQFCAGGAKTGNPCVLGAGVTQQHNTNGTTTVTICGTTGDGGGLSHSEIQVCTNTLPAGCP